MSAISVEIRLNFLPSIETEWPKGAGSKRGGDSGLGTTLDCIRGMYIIIQPFTRWLTQRKYIPIPKRHSRFNFIRFSRRESCEKEILDSKLIEMIWQRRDMAMPGHRSVYTLKETQILRF